MKYWILGITGFVLISCSGGSSEVGREKPFEVAFFVINYLQGNPPVASLWEGLTQLKKERAGALTLSMIEAGYNQAEWDSKFNKMVVTSSADLYVTSNPAMLGIVSELAQRYPHKRFMIFESPASPLPNVVTIDFRAEELAYLAGVYAVTFFAKTYPNIEPYLGILVGQEYPRMDAIIKRFRQGFDSTDSLGKTSYRVLGSWHDAERARQIAMQFYQSGVMGILTITGIANQGVIQAARENQGYVMLYEADIKDPILEEDLIVYAGFIDYKSLAYRLTREAAEGSLIFGEHHEYGIQDGVLGFLSTTAALRAHLAQVKPELEEVKTRAQQVET